MQYGMVGLLGARIDGLANLAVAVKSARRITSKMSKAALKKGCVFFQ